ncbi:hypothetical protein EPUL_004637 [Erysiphe pulchra]|uniref:Uncharacterized protein n=1 Tax=Erysiphe pulchra TaxID=225359 RepID=A0A2S4PT41_9PEZI|nr:hypothetical protein EPUL_004637 [Erysiphe pulchra]
MIKEKAVNPYCPAGDSSLPVTERERKIRLYFPVFFPRSEAEKSDGPLREAPSRNRVSFPQEWKFKYANSSILENYTAWSVRVSLEMDEDFIAARRSIHNNLWIGLHIVLGVPLIDLAQLKVHKGESSLQFARRLRKAVYALLADLILGPEVRDIQRNHIQQSLPRTWKPIQRDVSSMSKDEPADQVVQVTEGIERWTLEDQIFKKPQDPKPIPLVTYES